MGFHLPLLVLLLLLSPQMAAGAPAGRPPQCLSCHPPHHATRGTCSSCHRGNELSRRKEVAHTALIPGRYLLWRVQDTTRQKELITRYACRRCHVTGGLGNNLAANLDSTARTGHPLEIAAAIRKPSRFMPDFGFTEDDLTTLVNGVQAGASGISHPTTTGESPLTVHFQERQQRPQSVFEKRCGGCHKILTLHESGRGRGETGPNLSGLFSTFYPATFRSRERWTPRRLRTWLQNPRSIKGTAGMQPVVLEAREFHELCRTLTDIPSH